MIPAFQLLWSGQNGRKASFRHMLLCGLLFLLSGCVQKDLEFITGEMTTVKVSFVWEDQPAEMPEGMTVYFFPAGRHEQIWIYNLPARGESTIEIPTGFYRVITYNTDSEHIDFIDSGSFDSFRAATIPAPATKRPEGMDLCLQPSRLFTGADPDIMILSGTNHVTLHPRRCIATYNIILRNVVNLKGVRSLNGMIDGLNGFCQLSTGEGIGPAICEDFSLTRLTETEASGSMHCFCNVRSPFTQNLTLTAVIADGTRVTLSREITDHIYHAPDPYDLDIIIDGLRLPESGSEIGGESGLDVGVSDWSVVKIELNTDISYPRP